MEQDTALPHQIFEDAVCQIKTAASAVKARAIYRAALLCEDVLKRCENVAHVNFQTSLRRLKNLVELYADGLYEIDPSYLVVEASSAHPKINQDGLKKPALEKLDKTRPSKIKTENETAVSVLKPLMHFVKDKKQAGALYFLAGIDSQLDKAELPQASNQPSSVRFDNLMRRITNYTLREARALAKNISISYAADFEKIDTSISSNLEKYLQSICLEIIRNGLVINGDLAASINRTWQISLSGETQGDKLHITLSWQGQQLLDFGKSSKNKETLQSLNGKIKVRIIDGKQRKLDGHILELLCPARKPENINCAQANALQTQAREA